MKQAKLALSAVAVLAIVGGAVAFKSRTSTFAAYTQTTTAGPCNNLLGLQYHTTAAGAPIVSYATVSTVGACPLKARILPGE